MSGNFRADHRDLPVEHPQPGQGTQQRPAGVTLRQARNSQRLPQTRLAQPRRARGKPDRAHQLRRRRTRRGGPAQPLPSPDHPHRPSRVRTGGASPAGDHRRHRQTPPLSKPRLHRRVHRHRPMQQQPRDPLQRAGGRRSRQRHAPHPVPNHPHPSVGRHRRITPGGVGGRFGALGLGPSGSLSASMYTRFRSRNSRRPNREGLTAGTPLPYRPTRANRSLSACPLPRHPAAARGSPTGGLHTPLGGQQHRDPDE